MQRLSIIPDSSSYTASPQAGYNRVALIGGPGRYRSDSIDNAAIYDCTWLLDPEDYQYLAAFYRYFERKLEPFIVSLVLDSGDIQDYIAKIIPNSWRLISAKGLAYTVSCQIEAVPATLPDTAFDDALIALRSEYTDLAALTNPLEKLVNIDLPEA